MVKEIMQVMGRKIAQDGCLGSDGKVQSETIYQQMQYVEGKICCCFLLLGEKK